MKTMDQQNRIVAEITRELPPYTRGEHADLIVKACNAHYELLAACKQMMDLLRDSTVRFTICNGQGSNLGEQALYERTLKSARSAIAKAGAQ